MREGVNKVALRLFEHNEKAYHAAVRMMEQYGKAAIVHPTGTGKSYIAFKLIEDNPEKVVIWLSPSEYIFKTQLESLKRNDPDFPLANVLFYTYAKLMCCTQAQLEKIAAQKPAYIILDEFHRAGAECWGESTVALLKLCPEAKLLGLTATNIRYLDNNRDMAEELFDGHTASDMTLGEAVVRGILPAPKYVTTVYQYQKTLAKYQARVDNLRAPGIQDVNQKYLDALRRALEQADGLDLVFQHHITQTSGKYIVFCANKEHMDEMVSHVPEWFAGVNPDVVVYEAYSDDPNTDKAFADFKTDTSDRLKLLFCIDMLNEGVHVEGISGVILFRPTISPIIYKQQIGRALTAGDNTTPLILDVVNNFEGLTSISGLQGEMQEAVHRLYANGEGDKIVTERFEVIEQVHDCRVLFEQLQASLSSGWEHYFSEAKPNFVSRKGEPSKGAHKRVFIFASRLEENKGIKLLLELWKLLPKDYCLHIYGDGTLKNFVEENVKENISFYGFTPQKTIFEDLSTATALVFPSIWYEGFPMILAEAMAIGCPVVSTNIGNAGDILVNSKGGTTFEPDKPDTFINAIEDVLQNNKIYQKNALAYYSETLSKDKNYVLQNDIYEHLFGGG